MVKFLSHKKIHTTYLLVPQKVMEKAVLPSYSFSTHLTGESDGCFQESLCGCLVPIAHPVPWQRLIDSSRGGLQKGQWKRRSWWVTVHLQSWNEPNTTKPFFGFGIYFSRFQLIKLMSCNLPYKSNCDSLDLQKVRKPRTSWNSLGLNCGRPCKSWRMSWTEELNIIRPRIFSCGWGKEKLWVNKLHIVFFFLYCYVMFFVPCFFVL